MLIKKSGSLEGKIASSEIAPKDTFFNRRNFLRGAVAVGVGALALKQVPGLIHPEPVHADQQLAAVASKYTVPDAKTPFAKTTTYNNYYEFGTDKSDPAKNAHTLRTRPWTVQVSVGEEAADARYRRDHEVPGDREPRLPASLRGGVVDGDSVGRVLVQ